VKIRRQLFRTQIFSWGITVVVGVIVLVGLTRQVWYGQLRDLHQGELTQLETIRGGLFNLESSVRGFVLTGSEQSLEPYKRTQVQLPKDLETLGNLNQLGTPDFEPHRQIIDTIKRRLDTWAIEVAEPVILNRRISAERGLSTLLNVQSLENVILDEITANLTQYAQDTRSTLEIQHAQADVEFRALVWLTILWVIGAVVPSVVGWFFSTRHIALSLERLAGGARRLAEGDLTSRVNETSSLEVGQLGSALNDLADQLELSQSDLEARNAELRQYASSLEQATVFERSYSQTLRVFTSSYDRSHTLSEVLRLLAESHGFEIGAVYRYDEAATRFELSASRGAARGLEDRFGLRESLVGQAALDRRTIVLEDAPLVTLHTGLGRSPIRFTVIQPMNYQDRILGAIVLGHTQRPDASAIAFLEQISQQLGIALLNLDQYANLQRLSLELQERQDEIEIKNRDLERADKLKTEFLANMSHELRTPLNAVIGFSQLLDQQYYGGLNDKQVEYVSEIQSAGEHLLELINDILDLSKIEAGRMELDVETFELKPLLESCVRLVRERAIRAGLDLTLEVADGIEIVADARKLKQVVVNLLSNAVKFTPSGGSVRMRAYQLKRSREAQQLHSRRRGEWFEIAVTDTGIGINPEDQEKLFTAFMQVDGSLARRHEGTGLGLALSKRLTELHGGTITIKSELGKGSTFTARLPLKPRPPGEPQMDAPLVLIVEDDDRSADLIRAHLESTGYRTARARNGREGLELAAQLKPDAITLDLVMPVLDGWGFLEQVSLDVDLSRIPVIVVSVAQDLEHGVTLGAAGVVSKPITRDSLLGALLKAGLPGAAQDARVLIVDDDPMALERMASILEPLGFRVLRAADGLQALELAAREQPDLMILNLSLTEMNGLSVIESVRAQPETREMPVIALTGRTLSETDRLHLNGLGTRIIEKSNLERADLLNEVSRAVRLPEISA
jgi:signal transduction histidine kinase/CheY-like chemotaxis protein/CHASE3 domain sensor protein